MNEKTQVSEQRKGQIFALDIGTRSVIGLVGHGEGDRFQVQCVEREEYETRAVVDGQIENIAETAKVVETVKGRLEQKCGVQLQNVYIAAAGRVLRTMQASFSKDLDENEPISARTVSDLEIGAVQAAYERIFENEGEEHNTSFYCVGHAVQKYTLDGYDMSSLLEHKGRVAQTHIIATFLPRAVVESLYSTMGQCGLTVSGLTLEPIAAMNAIIPNDLRKLNLALVDIGAGTSDIALCEGGSVTAYTMATIAGDEVTEALMNVCLVDFATAEQLKHQLVGDADEMLHYMDILGMSHDVRREELIQGIQPTVMQLAKVIGERILEAGGHAPAAVFLAGGGSQVVGLAPLVAKELGLDGSRVAVGGALNMKRAILSDEDVYGPEFATPTGIALTAIRQRENDTFTVDVNGQSLHLLRSWDTSVLSVLQMAGYRYQEIMPRVGKSLYCTVNGERRVVRGQLPEQAEIHINGQPATLIEVVRPGDEIQFKAAQLGQDASSTVGELLGEIERFEVTFDGEPYPVGDIVTINGTPAEAETPVQQGDAIVVHEIKTVGAFCKEIELDMRTVSVFCNQEKAEEADALSSGDQIELQARGATMEEQPQQSLQEKTQAEQMPEGQTMSQPNEKAMADSHADSDKALATKPLHITLNHQACLLQPKADGTPYQFFDLLPMTEIDPEKPQGLIVQKRNGKDASYLEMLQENDTIEIYWERK